MEAQLTPSERQILLQVLHDRFSLDELINLAFGISIDYQDIVHDTKPNFARELLMIAMRRQVTSSLVAAIINETSDNRLLPIAAWLLPHELRTKLQMIFRGVHDTLMNKEQFKQAVAAALSAVDYALSPEEIEIIVAAKGSLHVLISLPASHVQALMALPKPIRFEDYLLTQIVPYEGLSPKSKEVWKRIAADPQWPPKVYWAHVYLKEYVRGHLTSGEVLLIALFCFIAGVFFAILMRQLFGR